MQPVPAARSAGGDRPSAGRGTTLVEVLVVLVILIIGMFSIAQLFPGGFFSIGHTGSVTQANALAQRNENVLLNLRENLPDAIVGFDPRTGLIRDDITPDDLHGDLPYQDNSINGYTGSPPPDPRFSNVNQVRRVLGEHFKLPPPVSNFGPLGETVSLYRALFSPIYSDTPMPGVSLGVSAYGATPQDRVQFEDVPSAGNVESLFNTGPFGYGINYVNRTMYFVMVDYERRYKVAFSYRDNSGQSGQTFPDNCLYVPAGAAPTLDSAGNPIQYQIMEFNLVNGQAQRVFTYDASTRQLLVAGAPGVTIPADCVWRINSALLAGWTVDLGSDLVHRRFRQLALNQRFSPDSSRGQTQIDPYEFKVYDTIFGLFGFHPAAATQQLAKQTARGLTARLDYDVDDWHILHQDEVVAQEFADPTATAGNRTHTLRVATGPIKRIADIEDIINFPAVLGSAGSVDTTFEYQGLVRFYPAYSRGPFTGIQRNGTPGVDLVIVDLETGYVIDSLTLQKAGTNINPGANNTNGEIDYEAGVVVLRENVRFRLPDAMGGTPLTGLTPIAGRHIRVYYRSVNDYAVATLKAATNYTFQNVLANMRHREYYPGYGYGYVLVNSTDADKGVTVDYTWINRNTGIVNTVTGELQKFQSPGLPSGPTAGYAGTGTELPDNRWWLRVAHSDADPSKGAADSGSDSDVLPGSVIIRGIRGASFHTRIVWREAGKFRSRERTTVLNRLYSR